MTKRPVPGANLPLAGVRILDFGIFIAAPYAASLLGDMGADVIKVESPKGDPHRKLDSEMGPGHSAFYFGINRSKRGLVLDLAQPESRSILDALVATADVALVSYRPRALERLGLTYEQLTRTRPDLVYASLTAYGESGPRVDQPGMDVLAQAISGIMGVTGETGQAPVRTGPPVGDFVGSFLLVSGILAALRVRDRDGIGQRVSVNLHDGGLSILANFITPFVKTKVPVQPVGSAHPNVVPMQAFRTSDGYIVVCCPTDVFWRNLWEALNADWLLADERYVTNPGRVAQRDELVTELERLFEKATSAEWIAKLTARDVPVAPVNSLADAINDPQTLHNGSIVELTHPAFGPYSVVQNPIRLSVTAIPARGYATEPGEHSAEILRDIGINDAIISDLLERGIVQSSTCP